MHGWSRRSQRATPAVADPVVASACRCEHCLHLEQEKEGVRASCRSFGALPREVWMTFGILELMCTVGFIVPAALRWQPPLTIPAAVKRTIAPWGRLKPWP
jgi:hypothetical protein